LAGDDPTNFQYTFFLIYKLTNLASFRDVSTIATKTYTSDESHSSSSQTLADFCSQKSRYFYSGQENRPTTKIIWFLCHKIDFIQC